MNLGIQRELRSGLVVSVDYVRNVATHTLRGVDTNHVGDAKFLNVAAAQNAIAATNGAFGCPATFASTSVDCAIAAGATIADFAGNGLDGGQFLGGVPSTLFGLTPDTGAAFPGINPLVGRNTMLFPSGRSVYNGLQTSLKGQLGAIAPGIKGLNIQVSYALSRFVSAVPAGIGDTDFVPVAADFNNPTRFIGPSSQDRKHQFSFGTILDMKDGARLSFIGHFYSPLAQTLYVPTAGAPGEIFRSDFTGDGEFGSQSQTGNGVFGDILPGTNVGALDRSVSPGDLNKVLNAYQSVFAGQLTPAGQALVSAGLMTQTQLQALRGVTPPVCGAAPTAPSGTCIPLALNGNVGLDWLRALDATFAWPIKIRERFTIEPSFSVFNLANFANFDAPNNKMGGVLNGAPGDANGTTAANRTNTRIGVGSGVYTLGAPRQMEFGLKFSF